MQRLNKILDNNSWDSWSVVRPSGLQYLLLIKESRYIAKDRSLLLHNVLLKHRKEKNEEN